MNTDESASSSVRSRAENERLLAEAEDAIRFAVRGADVPLSEVDDAKQFIRLKLWERLPAWQANNRAKFTTWASATARKLALTFKRQLFRQTSAGGKVFAKLSAVGDPDRPTWEPADDRGHEPDPVNTGDELFDSIHRAVRVALFGPALDALGERERRVVELVAIDGLDVGRVALQLDTTPHLVTLTLRRAIGRLAAAGKIPEVVAEACGVNVAELANTVNVQHRDQSAAERRKMVRDLDSQGIARSEIATRLGVSVNTVHADLAHLKKRPATAPLAGPRPDGATKRNQVRGLAAEGLTIPEIAERTGLRPNAVSQHLAIIRRGSADTPSPVVPTVGQAMADRRKVQTRQLADEGLTRQEIADRIGCSVSSVYSYLRTVAA